MHDETGVIPPQNQEVRFQRPDDLDRKLSFRSASHAGNGTPQVVNLVVTLTRRAWESQHDMPVRLHRIVCGEGTIGPLGVSRNQSKQFRNCALIEAIVKAKHQDPCGQAVKSGANFELRNSARTHRPTVGLMGAAWRRKPVDRQALTILDQKKIEGGHMANEVWGALISAVAGLGGVGLGAWLTGRSEREKERERVKREQSHGAAVLVANLEIFGRRCVEVTEDLGEEDEENGRTYPSAKEPQSSEILKDADWRSLPAAIVIRLLDLPHQQARIDARISDWFYHDDWYGDMADSFRERQRLYAEFGQVVVLLAQDLRRLVDLPTGAETDGWLLYNKLKQAVENVDKARRDAEDRRKLFPPLPWPESSQTADAPPMT